MRSFRTFIFLFIFYVWSALIAILSLTAWVMPRHYGVWAQNLWSWGTQRLIMPIAGIRIEYEGLENMPKNTSFMLAPKHSSIWETTAFQHILGDPAVVMKKELMSIPLLGWYARRLDMIPVDRGASTRAMRAMMKAAVRAIKNKRPILIFPEGTRFQRGKKPRYHPGIYGLYQTLKIPVVPVAHNAGTHWPADSKTTKPGIIRARMLKPIEPGLNKETFMMRLSTAIETETQALINAERQNI